VKKVTLGAQSYIERAKAVCLSSLLLKTPQSSSDENLGASAVQGPLFKDSDNVFASAQP
jgi:hypothetical protein